MNKYTTIFYALLVSLSFSFLGCQSNNSEPYRDLNSSFPLDNIKQSVTIILPSSSEELISNTQKVEIEVKAIDQVNSPYNSGVVSIVYPNDVRDGRDIGYFEQSSASVVNGVATFNYTAPKDLKENTKNIDFRFYHTDSNTTISDISNVLTYTFTIVPKEEQIILTNYELHTNSIEDISMSLETKKLVTYYVSDADDVLVENSKMTSMTITSLNPHLGTLEDTLGNTGYSVTVNNENSVNVNINSSTTSGIIPIKVNSVFEDVNGKTQTLEEVFNVIVVSGPPSAMSLSYAGTEQNSEKAKFIEKWILTVTDKYGNKVDNNPAVSTGMMAGFAKDSSHKNSNDANFLYYEPGSLGGRIDSNDDTFRTNCNCNVFDMVDPANDSLVVFGNGYTYNASGKWDIKSATGGVAYLSDDYDSNDISSLGYAVGHNYRQDTCEPGVEWVGNVYPKDNNYILDSSGVMELNVEYDYYLTGKSVMLWVNLIGQQYGSNQNIRIGEAKKINLRGVGLTSEEVTVPQGFQGLVRLKVWVKGTVEYYYNSNFGYAVTMGVKDANWTYAGDSMDYPTTDCGYNGIGYVDVVFLSPTAEEGTVGLNEADLLPSDEF